MTISQRTSHVNGITLEIAQYHAKIEQLQSENTQLRKQNKTLRAREKWMKDFIGLSNQKVSAVDKVVTLATLWDIEERDKKLDELSPVFIPNIADRGGVGEKTVSLSHKKLALIDAIEKEVQRDKNGKKHLSIAFNPDFLTSPDSIVEQVVASNYGGDRRTPCECGCGEFVKRTVTKGTRQVIITCKQCGTVQSDETKILDKVTNSDVVAFDASERDELAELDERVDSLDFSEIVDIPDEEFIPTYDEPLTLFPVEKKPVQGSVPFADMPEGARVALQAVFHRECFSCHDAGRETRWKPVQRDDNSWIAACEYCSTHKGK